MEPRDVLNRDTPRAAAKRARAMHAPALAPSTSRKADLTPYGVGALALAAAIGGALADCRPLDHEMTDAILTGAFAALVTVAASGARRWTWLVLAGIAALGASTWATLVPAAAAVVLAVGSATLMRRRNRLVGAGVGALSVQVLLRLPEWRFTGVSALVASVGVGIVFVSAYRLARRRTRRRIRIALVAGGAALGLVVVTFGVFALLGRAHAQAGLAEARLGFDAARSGDRSVAIDHFDLAASEFEAAKADFASAPARVARGVPLVGQQQRAAAAMATAGEDLTRAASASATAAPYEDLASSAGSVDLALLASMEEPVTRARDALARADNGLGGVDSVWLLPPLRDPMDEFHDQIRDARRQAEMAADGVAVAPGLLGADGPRRYLVLFGTPAEARYLGGFVGAYAELEVDQGKVTLGRSGSIQELSNRPDADQRSLTGMDAYLARYGRFRPQRYLQNITASPDFPTVAEAARQLYPQAGGAPIDGVVYIEPEGLAALLSLTGPVAVEGLAEPLTSENAASFLLRDQYTRYPVSDLRNDLLTRATRATFEALTSRHLPGPRSLGEALGPAVERGQIMFSAFGDADATAFLSRIGLTGAFGAEDAAADFLSFRTSNGGASKIDAYLDRDIDHRVTADPGSATYEVVTTVRLHNNAPGSGLPDYVIANNPPAGLPGAPPGTNVCDFGLWTDAELLGATADGVDMPVQAEHELGHRVYSGRVLVPPGATVTLVFRGHGSMASGYALDAVPQPAAGTSHLSVEVTPAPGWLVDGAEGLEVVSPSLASGSWTFDTNRHVAVDFGS